MTKRLVETRYDDPVSLIWTHVVHRLGMSLVRSDETYASYDGAGTLTIANDEALDADDNLGQMILHELCHALVQGERALKLRDWGLENMDDSMLVHEHACHRLQAYLSGHVGLRSFMAVTTEHRAYYDALPPNPLVGSDDSAIELAQEALLLAKRLGWYDVLMDALEATASIGRMIKSYSPESSLWARVKQPHPIGEFMLGAGDGACGSCAWAYRGGPGPLVWRCRQSRLEHRGLGLRIEEEWPACERYEPNLSVAACAECGACCHEGFHLVEVGAKEPIAQLHPDLVVNDAHGAHLPRPGGYCVALKNDSNAGYRCGHYAIRPRHCSELKVGGDACLIARKRVGLSR